MELNNKYYIIRTASKYSTKETDRRFEDLASARQCFDTLGMELYKKAAIVEVTERVAVIKYNQG